MNKRPDKSAQYGRFDLIPPIALIRLAKLYGQDAKAYGARDWEQGRNLSEYVNDAMIHLNLLLARDSTDDHAIRVVWNMLAYVANQHMIHAGKLPSELNDMPGALPAYYDDAVVTEAPAQVHQLEANKVPALPAPQIEVASAPDVPEIPSASNIPSIPEIPPLPSKKK